MGTSQLPRLPLARKFGVLTKSGVWSCKHQRNNHTAKAKLYAQRQEAARKDVERAFGVLQKRWAIIRHPARLWEREELADIMYACIILHNMIVEDEQENAHNTDFLDIGQLAVPYPNNPDRQAFVAASHRLHDRTMHFQLQSDLIEHQWFRLGSLHQ